MYNLMKFVSVTLFVFLVVNRVNAAEEIPYNQIDDDGNPNTWDDDLDNDHTCLKLEELNDLSLHKRYSLLGYRQCSRTVGDCDDTMSSLPITEMYGADSCEGGQGRYYPGAIISFCVIPKDNNLPCPSTQYGPGALPHLYYIDGKATVDTAYCQVDNTITVRETNRFNKPGCFKGHDVDCDGLIDAYPADCSFMDKDGDSSAALKYGGKDCCDEGSTEEKLQFRLCSENAKTQMTGFIENSDDLVDNDCNGLIDETKDLDGDNILDIFESGNCLSQSTTQRELVDADGCWYSISSEFAFNNHNLKGWDAV